MRIIIAIATNTENTYFHIMKITAKILIKTRTRILIIVKSKTEKIKKKKKKNDGNNTTNGDKNML